MKNILNDCERNAINLAEKSFCEDYSQRYVYYWRMPSKNSFDGNYRKFKVRLDWKSSHSSDDQLSATMPTHCRHCVTSFCRIKSGN